VETQKQTHHLHIAVPILNNQNNEENNNLKQEKNESICEEDLNVSDFEDIEENVNNSDEEEVIILMII